MIFQRSSCDGASIVAKILQEAICKLRIMEF